MRICLNSTQISYNGELGLRGLETQYCVKQPVPVLGRGQLRNETQTGVEQLQQQEAITVFKQWDNEIEPITQHSQQKMAEIIANIATATPYVSAAVIACARSDVCMWCSNAWYISTTLSTT